MLIMRDKPSLNKNKLHRRHWTYSTGLGNKIILRVLFALIVATLFLLNGLFYYFVTCKRMSITARVNGIVQFTFFLIIRFRITIITSCDSLIVILVT